MSTDELTAFRLKQLEARFDSLDGKVDEIRDQVIGWKAKATAIGGLISLIVSLIMGYLYGGHKP